MKANRLVLTVLLLVTAAVFQLLAQQNEADRKVLGEIRAGADKGDAKAQYELGRAFFSGTLGVAKDEEEAVKWFRKAAEQCRRCSIQSGRLLRQRPRGGGG
jgi:TPR repeat protein